jgi:hypothetical protein
LFHKSYSNLERQANELSEGVTRQNYLLNVEAGENAESIDFQDIYMLLNNAFDTVNGGMTGVPKFPMPVVLRFVMQYGIGHNNENALKFVELTLHKMVCGGIYDQVGGGFARYSTDSEWKAPHFEKMLYDNAQLVSLYSSAFQHTGIALYREVVEQTIEFISREFTAREGVFYSALDADSEGEEGLFYTWTTEQFNEALGHYAELAGKYYGIGAGGLWEHGQNILLRTENDILFAQQNYLSTEELAALISFCRKQLLKIRSVRPRPGLDDKMLVSWNAMMISALLDASVALDNEEYLKSALQAARFILSTMKRPQGGLFHIWKNGKSHIAAFLDDYTFTCEALLKLYALTSDEFWLHEAGIFAAYVVEKFYDSHSGFFWYSENDDKHVFARKIEIYDGVIPSGNSAMANVLNTLGVFLHNSDYKEKVRQMLIAMENRYARYPAAYANWALLALYTKQEFLVAVIGKDTAPVIKKLMRKSISGTLIFGSQKVSELPYFANRYVEGKTLIYICSGAYCLAPVETVEEAVLLINNRN